VSTNSGCCVGQESAFWVAATGMKVYGSRRFCRKPLKRIKEETKQKCGRSIKMNQQLQRESVARRIRHDLRLETRTALSHLIVCSANGVSEVSKMESHSAKTIAT